MKKVEIKRKPDKKKLKQLGLIIKIERVKLGLTVREVGKKIDFSYSALASLERGDYAKATIDVLYRLSDFYKINVDELLKLASKIPPNAFWKTVDNFDVIVPLIYNYEVK